MILLRQIIALFMVAVIMTSFVVASAQAADYQAVECNEANGLARGGFFPIEALGQNCEASDTPHIFSRIVCGFVGIMNKVIGTMYCGMQAALLPIVSIVITIYVMIYGAQILMGTAKLNGGEVAKHAIKIGLIWTFASEAAWGLGMLYNFFIGFSLQGIDWALAVTTLCQEQRCDINYELGTISNIFSQIDAKLYHAVTTLFSERSELFTLLLMISLIAPTVFLMGISLLWMTLNIFVRSLLSFLMGISAVAFLIALSPIFLSMMLFKSTAQFFDSWIKYMISYSLQPIITFACFAMWLGVSTHFMDFTSDLSKIIVPYKSIVNKTVGVVAEDSKAFCKLKKPMEYSAKGPRIECENDNDIVNATPDKLLTFDAIVKDKDFMYYLGYHLATLLVIAYAFSALIQSAPQIARQLSGPQTATPLGAGFGGLGTLQSAFAGASDKMSISSTKAREEGGGNSYIAGLGKLLGRR